MAGSEMGFWDHAEALRGVILRMVAVVMAASAMLFAAMPWIFDHVILAPCGADFPLYDLLSKLPASVGGEEMMSDFDVKLININLASQFFMHVTSSVWMAVIVTFPCLVWLLWRFVAPALYADERRGATRALLAGGGMFYLGAATGYFVVFPLTLRFLAGYQLSARIPNEISLDSYMDNFMTLILVMGIVFELPLVTALLGRMGVIGRGFFSRYRRHAIVVLLIAAAIITPTGDPFTLLVVFLPLYILWELSALTVSGAPATSVPLRRDI